MGFGRGGRGDLDDGMSGGHELDFGQDRPRRWLAFAGAGLVLIAVMVAVILAMGGSSQTADGPPPGATVGEEFNPVLENTENTAEETKSMDSTMPETTSAGTTGEESGDTEEEQGEEGEGQGEGQEEGQGEDVARAGPEPGERSGDSGGNLAEEYEPRENESLDPAGRHPEPGDLTVTDKQRVEFAVSQFVTAVYGYTGTDPDEYVNEIGRTITGEEFYDSPASDEILEISDEVDVSGLESAAKVQEFEVTDTQPGKVLGKARFDMADSYSRYGDLEGDKTSYVQEITLLAEGEVYKVSAAGEREESE